MLLELREGLFEARRGDRCDIGGLIKGAFLKGELLQFHNWSEHEVTHLFVLGPLPKPLHTYPIDPVMYGTLCVILVSGSLNLQSMLS